MRAPCAIPEENKRNVPRHKAALGNLGEPDVRYKAKKQTLYKRAVIIIKTC